MTRSQKCFWFALLMVWAVIPLAQADDDEDRGPVYSWENVIGCYKTISYNGKKLPDSEFNYGAIRFTDSAFFYTDLDGKAVPAVEGLLFYGKNQNDDEENNYVVHSVPYQKGEMSRGKDKFQHNFSGQLRYIGNQAVIFQYDIDTNVAKINDRRIRLKGNVRAVQDGHDPYVEESDFVLEKIDCRN